MKADIAARLEELEKTAQDHEGRLVTLEKKLNPKTAEEMSSTVLDMLLAELGGSDSHT